MESTGKPTLRELELELAARILCLGAFLNASLGDTAGNSPGNRCLSLDEDDFGRPWMTDVTEIDVRRYRVGRLLPYLYSYAYEGVRGPVEGCDLHTDPSDWNDEYGDREIFYSFLDVTDTEVISNIDADKTMLGRQSKLWDMLRRAQARFNLDSGNPVTIAEIALLANMNERSVRNALRAEGDARLQSENGEEVTHEEALRWLRSRRSGFRETTDAARSSSELPKALRYAEIGPFIASRIRRFFPDREENEYVGDLEAARTIGWTQKRLRAVMEDAGNIRPQDCNDLAKLVRVDPVWFTEQVMYALFPDQMSVLMKRQPEPVAAPLPFVEVTLTENQIKNGYLDVPQEHSSLFPDDSFGQRSPKNAGKPVEFRYGGLSRETDIRQKSGLTISPRIRFEAYFKSTLGAKPGDVIRITRLGDRVYELNHVRNG